MGDERFVGGGIVVLEGGELKYEGLEVFELGQAG